MDFSLGKYGCKINKGKFNVTEKVRSTVGKHFVQFSWKSEESNSQAHINEGGKHYKLEKMWKDQSNVDQCYLGGMEWNCQVILKCNV